MLSFSLAARNAVLDAIRTLIDSGVADGKIRIYSGTRPANGAAITSQILLSEHNFSDPCAPAASGGVLTFSAIDSDIALGTGVATWARILTSANDHVIDADVGSLSSSAEVKINDINIEEAATVNVLSAVLRMSA